MAQTARTVTSVDKFTWRDNGVQRDTLGEWFKNTAGLGNVCAVRSRFEQYDTLARFGMAFIDGAHGYESVRHDALKATRLVEPGSPLAFHDYRDYPGQHDGRWDADVTRAVNDLLSNGYTEVDRFGTVIVLTSDWV